MLSGWFSWFIILWGFFLISTFTIGGYFMFRKFLKRLPKEDGKSILDWQEYYIQETAHLWTDELIYLLELLVQPVPELFRDIARNKIIGKIGEVVLQEKASIITQDYVIKGYILATPKRDHKFLIKTLHKQNINMKEFEHLFS